VRERGAPIVVKADGLAAGKGVVVAVTVDEAVAAVEAMFGGALGEAGAAVVIEAYLDGEEASFFALCDGERAVPFGTAQDHKRAFDGDQGPNTGGMGAYSPAPVLTEEICAQVMEQMVTPTLRALAAMGSPYKGVLYVGVMITKDPFDAENKDSVYISAVCGHNSKVVDNSGLPEQILFNPKSNSVVVMTLSQQESALAFDENGDLKETSDKCANTQKRVLTDLQARALAKSAISIRRVFGTKEQDIEWGIMNGRIYIVQARPYIDKQ
jgi:hypothetical protein